MFGEIHFGRPPGDPLPGAQKSNLDQTKKNLGIILKMPETKIQKSKQKKGLGLRGLGVSKTFFYKNTHSNMQDLIRIDQD